MAFREIEFGSEDFRRECALRHEVLRVPLALNLYDENLSLERGQLHFGQFDEKENLVACVIAVPLSPTKAKIRQLTVGFEHQGKGCGTSLLRRLEVDLMRRGFTQLCLHARLTVAGFYEKMGYTRTGPEFVEVGLSHVEMEKAVFPSDTLS